MDADTLLAALLHRLPYTPNDQQSAVAAALTRFVCAPADPSGNVFVLNGYAGTGKTTLTGALVGALESSGTKAVLMAPTGRAAKVFSANSAGRRAWTIHRRIYRHAPGGIPGSGEYAPGAQAPNREQGAVFIVDEASMIGTADERGASLLHDLLQYVFDGRECRLILMGDTAQLPPVGAEKSPAMNISFLRSLGLKVSGATLTATARQAADSGILFNATRLRRAMAAAIAAADSPAAVPKLRVNGFPDVRSVSGEDLPELLEKSYADSLTDTIVITRSNRRATEYNRAIRSAVLWREEEITRDDMLIVARNHYFSRRDKGMPDFVANGDIVAVERVYGTETRYGMRLADVCLRLPEGNTFDIKILLDNLSSEEANLSREAWLNLYSGILSDNDRFGDTPQTERAASLATDPYWNALHVKYAYAITCHKAQGGQWNDVFVDLAYIPEDALGLPLYRWLYTAITRARTHLYLISPPEQLLE